MACVPFESFDFTLPVGTFPVSIPLASGMCLTPYMPPIDARAPHPTASHLHAPRAGAATLPYGRLAANPHPPVESLLTPCSGRHPSAGQRAGQPVLLPAAAPRVLRAAARQAFMDEQRLLDRRRGTTGGAAMVHCRVLLHHCGTARDGNARRPAGIQVESRTPIGAAMNGAAL
jgi:hypothetical protein